MSAIIEKLHLNYESMFFFKNYIIVVEIEQAAMNYVFKTYIF